MHKTLRNIFRLEKSGSKLAYSDYPFTFAQDYTYLTAKVKEIEGLINDFFDGPVSSRYANILTKIVHAFEMTIKSVPVENDEALKQSELLVSILNTHSTLTHRSRKHKRLSEAGLSLSFQAVGVSAENNFSAGGESGESDENCAPAAAVTGISAEWLLRSLLLYRFISGICSMMELPCLLMHFWRMLKNLVSLEMFLRPVMCFGWGFIHR